MPHQVAFSAAYLIILASAAENALNSLQAPAASPCARSAAWIACRFLLGVVAQPEEFLDAGRLLLLRAGWNCAAAGTGQTPAPSNAAMNTARRKFMANPSMARGSYYTEARRPIAVYQACRMRRERGNRRKIGGPRQAPRLA